MIEEQGRVVATEPGLVWVETQRQSACDACESKAGCGHSVLARLGGKTVHMQALCDLNVAVGDLVMVGIPEQVLLKSSFLAYLMPLITMLAAALMADLWWGSDLIVGAAAILGLGLGFGLLGLHFRRHQHDQRFQPVVIKRLCSGAVGGC